MVPALVADVEVDPWRTAYRGVRRIPPGHALEVDRGIVAVVRLDDFEARADNSRVPLAEAADCMRQLINEAISRRVSGYQRAGVLASGGLDSSVVAFEARRVVPDVVAIHGTCRHPALDDERQTAVAVAECIGLPLQVLDFSAALEPGGDCLSCMAGLRTGAGYSFFHCFRQAAELAAAQGLSVLATGHLGDSLLQADEPDAVRAELIVASPPLSFIHAVTRTASWYRGRHPFTDLLSALAARRQMRAPQRHRFRHWLTERAARAADEMSYEWPTANFPLKASRNLYGALHSSLSHHDDVETILQYDATLPFGVVLAHPYADRDLLNYCLTLGPQHRARYHAGLRFSKVATRAAYLGLLPREVIRRESRVPYAAVAEEYVRNNRRVLATVLKEGCLLQELGVLNAGRVKALLEDERAWQPVADELIKTAAVELWLLGFGSMKPAGVTEAHSAIS